MKVSVNALQKRISRKYYDERPFYRLRKSRGLRLQQEVGDYYIIDEDRNLIVAYEGDVEGWARKHEVLDASEKVTE